jgi:hypothetical protein
MSDGNVPDQGGSGRFVVADRAVPPSSAARHIMFDRPPERFGSSRQSAPLSRSSATAVTRRGRCGSASVAAGVAHDVRQPLGDRGHQLVGDEVGQWSTSPTMRSSGSKPRCRDRSWTNSVSCADRLRCSPCWPRRKIAARSSRIVSSSSLIVLRSDRRPRWLRLRLDRLEAHPGGEEALDHHVVEVAGDAFAVEQHRHLAADSWRSLTSRIVAIVCCVPRS